MSRHPEDRVAILIGINANLGREVKDLEHKVESQALMLAEQQAHIEFLRLTLEHYAEQDVRNARHYPPEFAKDALTATPEVSLRKHDTKLVERIADFILHKDYDNDPYILAGKIRRGEFK